MNEMGRGDMGPIFRSPAPYTGSSESYTGISDISIRQ